MKKYIFIFLIILMGCSSDNETSDPILKEEAMEEITDEVTDETETEQETSNNLAPVSTSYILPENNKACTGEETSEALINVDFEWNSYEDDTDTTLMYSLEVIDLFANTALPIVTTTNTYAQITLQKGITYEWTVSATDSSDEKVTGEVWQFQTPFDAVANYAPFPAKLLAPKNGTTQSSNTTTLSWEGNDPDEEETTSLKYDIFLGTTNPPALVNAHQEEVFYTTDLAEGIYYWKIVSRDVNNNASSSQIYQFIISE